jgi:hypothetical protein
MADVRLVLWRLQERQLLINLLTRFNGFLLLALNF